MIIVLKVENVTLFIVRFFSPTMCIILNRLSVYKGFWFIKALYICHRSYSKAWRYFCCDPQPINVIFQCLTVIMIEFHFSLQCRPMMRGSFQVLLTKQQLCGKSRKTIRYMFLYIYVINKSQIYISMYNMNNI